MLLLAMGSLGWEAFGRFRSPEPIQGLKIIVVAAVGIVVSSIATYQSDSFYQVVTHELREQFDTDHVIIQVITSPFAP